MISYSVICCVLFQGGPFHDVLHSILGAYTCYRPDVGYVSYCSITFTNKGYYLFIVVIEMCEIESKSHTKMTYKCTFISV